MKKKQIIIRPDKKVFEFEGRTFKEKLTKFKKVDGIEHINYTIFEEVDLEQQKKKIDVLKEKLKGSIPQERIIEEILKGMPTSQIDRVHKLLTQKKAKVKRQDGCMGIKIDGGKHNSTYIPIFD